MTHTHARPCTVRLLSRQEASAHTQQLDTHRAHTPEFYLLSLQRLHTSTRHSRMQDPSTPSHMHAQHERAARSLTVSSKLAVRLSIRARNARTQDAHTRRAHKTHATHNAVDAGCDVCYFRQAVQLSVCTCGKSRKERTTTQMKDTSRSSGMCQYKLYAFFNVYKRRSGTRMFSTCA